ncbi:molybdenum cofactor guanylyltransferase [Ornithinibacillus salinisoli]
MKICSVVLSGGKSSRMGTNKALLELHDKKVIEHIIEQLNDCGDQIVVVANEKSDYDFLNVPILSDRYQNKGPLAGMETVMYHVEADLYLFSACDMPFVAPQIYHYLMDHLVDKDAIVPVFQDHIHPLSGIYKRSCLPFIQELIHNNQLSVRNLFKHMNVTFVEDYAGIPSDKLKKHFFNMNHPSDYEKAKLLQ